MFLIPVALFIIAIVIYKKIKKSMAYKSLFNTLIEIANLDNVKCIKSKAFDYEVKYCNKTYLIKMIYHPNAYEINVNSRDYWQVNKGAVSSRKSGEKMDKVYDLINYEPQKNGYPEDTIKLYVIYPFSSTLMKVINECEYEFVKPTTNIYGCKMTNFTKLKEDFNKF
jgi:hypothetical protein